MANSLYGMVVTPPRYIRPLDNAAGSTPSPMRKKISPQEPDSQYTYYQELWPQSTYYKEPSPQSEIPYPITAMNLKYTHNGTFSVQESSDDEQESIPFAPLATEQQIKIYEAFKPDSDHDEQETHELAMHSPDESSLINSPLNFPDDQKSQLGSALLAALNQLALEKTESNQSDSSMSSASNSSELCMTYLNVNTR